MPAAREAPLDTALAHATQLMARQPILAVKQAEEILKLLPGEPRARLILAGARRRLGQVGEARTILEPLAREQPGAAHVHLELGLSLAALGEAAPAKAALRDAVALNRALPEAWRVLGDLLILEGETEGADQAYAESIRASVTDPTLLAAADALCDDRIAIAERILRERIKARPTDVAALRMLAEAGTRLGRYGDAEAILERCLELSPGFHAARYNLALVLYRQQKGAAALGHLDRLRAADPQEAAYRNLAAACLGIVGDYARAIALYEEVLAERPDQPKILLSYGHALRTAGRREDAISAYNRAIALSPGLGDAYWSLANLKTVAFSSAEEAAISAQLARTDLGREDRLHLHYALGKALEDRGAFEASFIHYTEGARLRRVDLPYDADAASAQTERAKALFTPAFFEARRAGGCSCEAPIFILGLPRSGSTLIEQILASHSHVEGTMELPDIAALVREISGGVSPAALARYPGVLAELDPAQRTALGEAFLERTRVHRKLGRPFFIDKMPNNWRHIGLIHLILPRAKIIDSRRHPMASCFSNFKQHFARGQAFSYDLTDLGRYYRDYLDLMRHFDTVLPGRIHRVIHEDVVEDLEGETRRLLAYCGLDFEAGVLNFHENKRAVRTASSEQVRRPIFRDGLDHWRSYEPWLGPLKAALGEAVDSWR
jgi:tetratricopeptide (TPR) repeat protein